MKHYNFSEVKLLGHFFLILWKNLNRVYLRHHSMKFVRFCINFSTYKQLSFYIELMFLPPFPPFILQTDPPWSGSILRNKTKHYMLLTYFVWEVCTMTCICWFFLPSLYNHPFKKKCRCENRKFCIFQKWPLLPLHTMANQGFLAFKARKGRLKFSIRICKGKV